MSGRDLGARVRSRFRRYGVVASDAQVEQLLSYIGLLTKWNKTVNLTALPLDPPSDKAVDRLVVEPLLAARSLAHWRGGQRRNDVATGELVIDVGSGGGSPAIPLAIALPGCQLRMIEAKGRKSAFLREAVRHLGLQNAEVLNSRLEELLARPELHEAASVISIRAVRADQALWKTLAAFARPGGHVLWFRSRADKLTAAIFLPAFLLEALEPLIPADGSELAILRKPGQARQV